MRAVGPEDLARGAIIEPDLEKVGRRLRILGVVVRGVLPVLVQPPEPERQPRALALEESPPRTRGSTVERPSRPACREKIWPLSEKAAVSESLHSRRHLSKPSCLPRWSESGQPEIGTSINQEDRKRLLRPITSPGSVTCRPACGRHGSCLGKFYSLPARSVAVFENIWRTKKC